MDDGGRSSVIVRLDEQARGGHSCNLSGVIPLMRSCHDQECPMLQYHPANPAPCLLQERFAAGQSAELLGSVVARDSSSQGKESLAITTGQNYSPTVRILYTYVPSRAPSVCRIAGTAQTSDCVHGFPPEMANGRRDCI